MQTPGPERLLQSPSFEQGPHAFAVEQSGVVLGQSALVTQTTQAPLGAHAGLARSWAAQAPAPAGACAQPTQAPFAAQKDRLASWQSASPAHSTQAPVEPHAGWAASFLAHAAPPLGAPIEHATHVAVAAAQRGLFASWQSTSAPHSTQAPFAAQTGWATSFFPQADA